MYKKKFLIVLLFLTISCGFEPMHSKKNRTNYNFSITKIDFRGDRDLNIKLREKLKKYIVTEEKSRSNFVLIIDSISEKTVLTRDVKGDPTSFGNRIMILVDVIGENKNKSQLKFEENFNYDNIADKFDLRSYEIQLKNNSIETIANKLFLKLSTIQ